MKNLNVRLSLLIGFLSFVIAIGIGSYTNSISTLKLEQTSGESLLRLSKRIADVLDREMLERYREIKFASEISIMTDSSVSKEEKRAYIQKIKDSYNHHGWIGFAKPDGTVYVGTDGYLEGKNAKARPWHPAGLKGAYIGDVHDALLLAKLMPNTSGEAIYFSDVAFPVKDYKTNKVSGVLCTHLSWQWTRDIIRSIQKENGVDIFLLSKDGLILVGPENSERKNISEISQNIAQLVKEDISKYFVADWKFQEEYLTAHTVSKGFEEYKGFGWKVVVRQTMEDAFIKANDTHSKILLVSILFGIAGALFGVVIANVISSPLKNLIQIVDKIRNNEKVVFGSQTTQDDFGKLYSSIKDLYEGLQEEHIMKVHEQQKVQLALKVFDQSYEGVIITDDQNNIILINKAFEKITGYTHQDVFGKNPSILSVDGNEAIHKMMWDSIEKTGKWEGTLKNKTKQGTIYEEYLKITTIKDENDKVVNYVATFTSGFQS